MRSTELHHERISAIGAEFAQERTVGQRRVETRVQRVSEDVNGDTICQLIPQTRRGQVRLPVVDRLGHAGADEFVEIPGAGDGRFPHAHRRFLI